MQERVVLAGQIAPHRLHREVFAPLEFLQEWQAVEQLAIHVPRRTDKQLAVGEKFHIVHQIESHLVVHESHIGGWHDEQRKRHFVPLHGCIGVEIDKSP